MAQSHGGIWIGWSTGSLLQRGSMGSAEENWELEVRVKSLSRKGVCLVRVHSQGPHQPTWSL